MFFFQEYFLKKGWGGVDFPKLYVEFWWLLFLAMKFTCLFIPKFGQSSHFYSQMYRGGGANVLGNIHKKTFLVLPLNRNRRIQRYPNWRRGAVLNRVGFMMNAASTVECVCPNCTAFQRKNVYNASVLAIDRERHSYKVLVYMLQKACFQTAPL